MKYTNREAFEFDCQTKALAKELQEGRCEICGGEESRHDPFEYDHRLAIWYAREIGGALSAEVISSLANCSVVHRSCHREKHKNEDRAFYRALAPKLLSAYLDLTAEEQDLRDLWRDEVFPERQYAINY